MAGRIVALRLTETEYQALSELATRRYRGTLSRVLREAIMLLMDQSKIRFETKLKIRQERLKHPMRRGKDLA